MHGESSNYKVTNLQDVDSECDEDDVWWSDSSQDTDSDSNKNLKSHIIAQEYEIHDKLANWAGTFNVTHAALSALLCILCNYFPNLPKDARTLLKTPRAVNTIKVDNGSYYHFGVANGIKKILEKYPCNQPKDKITFQVGIDGLPLFKSSADSFWPIIGLLDKPCIKEPFLIGLYHGVKKPSNAADLLSHFVEEMQDLETVGLLYHKNFIKVVISAII